MTRAGKKEGPAAEEAARPQVERGASSVHERASAANVVRGPWSGEDLGLDEDLYYARVADGVYLAGYVRHRTVKRWRRSVHEVLMRILDVVDVAPTPLGVPLDDPIGLVLVYPVNRPDMPKPGRRVSLRGTLALDYRQLVGLRPPRRLDRVSPRDVYAETQLEVEVRAVGRNWRGDEIPPAARYSRIVRVRRLVAGTPPAARRGGT